VVDQLVDIFGSRVVFSKEIQSGDEFAIVYTERVLPDGEKLEPGPITAASLKVSGKMMAAVRHVGKDGQERYFSETGDSLDQYFLRYPVQFTRISSVFTTSRFHPVLKRSRPHHGVDFAAPTGTPVRTIADGVVVYSGYNGGSGNMVKISHGSRWQTSYLHLSKITSNLKRGSKVSRGQVIGAVGATGLATGPHLHFGMYDNGRYVDPLKVQLPRQPIGKGNTISPQYLQAAIQTLEQHHQVMRLALAMGFSSDTKANS